MSDEQDSLSRLIIKNLPGHLTEERFKKHFSKKGIVTDVKIVRTKGGKSRKFGYIGYKTPQEAKQAKAYFDNSFVDTSRISVDFAYAPGDASIPRPWSKYSKGSSAYLKQHKPPAPEFKKTDTIDDIFDKGSKKRKRDEDDDEVAKGGIKKSKTVQNKDEEGKEKDEDLTNDPAFKEYMKLMKKNSKFWENDDGTVQEETKPVKQKKQVKKVVDSDDSDDSDESDSEEYQQIAGKTSKSSDESDDSGDEDSSDDSESHSDGVANNPEISDLEYLKRRTSANIKVEESSDSSSSSSSEGSSVSSSSSDSSDDSESESSDSGEKKKSKKKKKNSKDKKESRSLLYAPFVGDSGRLFVRNLAYDCTEEDLQALFSKFGEVSSVHIPIDKRTGKSKCIAFILYTFPPDALVAQQKLDGTSFQGRLLHILPAKEALEKKHDLEGSTSAAHLSKFQKEKLAKLIGSAGQSDSWNPLFMRADTVVNAMAEKYNVDKADILDPSANDMALRQALGETNIIAETKKFLEDEGVAVEALEGLRKKEANVQRSKNVILVKNISYATNESEIKNLFARFGSVSKVVLPPSKTMALVEFAQPSEARAAFTSLAYREHFGVPLFLEWAPTNVWNEKKLQQDKELSEKQKAAEEATQTKAVDVSKAQILAREEEERAEQEQHEAQSTLFIKNINWDTSEKDLQDFFSGKLQSLKKLRGIRRVTIAKKRDPKNEAKLLSLGYGFVEFATREDAMDAMKQLQGKLLDGHALEISFSQKGVQSKKQNTKHKALEERNDVSTKLMVRNVPFQANKNELRKLFAAYGEVKSLRIPVKQGGKGHRGFAFVEYLTKEEAANAMKMLANTHLYGRHLVIDFEKGEEGLDEVREKTRHLFEKTQK